MHTQWKAKPREREIQSQTSRMLTAIGGSTSILFNLPQGINSMLCKKSKRPSRRQGNEGRAGGQDRGQPLREARQTNSSQARGRRMKVGQTEAQGVVRAEFRRKHLDEGEGWNGGKEGRGEGRDS